MGKQILYWGIGCAAALGVAGVVYMRPPAPMAPANAVLQSVPQSVSGTKPKPASASVPPKAPALHAESTPPTATKPDAHNRATPEALAVNRATPEALAVNRATPEALAVAPEKIAPEVSAAQPTASAPAPVSIVAPAPDVASGLEAALPLPDAAKDSSSTIQPDSKVSKTAAPQAGATPDALLPAPALGGSPDAGTMPALATETATAPTAQAAPHIGASTSPLTLAQVLLPGEAPTADQVAPRFDLVRVAPDGSAVIAGRAAPGADVQVFSGAVPVAEATANARGEFVAFLDPPDTPTLDLHIPAAPKGASLVVSQDDIIILPAPPDAEDAAPMVLHRTPDSVQIVQPAGPAIPSHISLDLVSYSNSGAVQLAGRGQPGNVARIYTDNTLVGEATIGSEGHWQLEIAGIAAGRYVLRVDEISPDGAVLSRTESPFQRQFPEAQLPKTFSQGAKIIVQPGNTLWLMATEAYGNGDAYAQIFSANKAAIRDPNLIYPGQIFTIPRVDK